MWSNNGCGVCEKCVRRRIRRCREIRSSVAELCQSVAMRHTSARCSAQSLERVIKLWPQQTRLGPCPPLASSNLLDKEERKSPLCYRFPAGDVRKAAIAEPKLKAEQTLIFHGDFSDTSEINHVDLPS
ncbi:hypothetical protein AOLI_G00119120 [Acnodon oligacanthus]